MSGDVHARFSEGVGVKFPCATQLVILSRTRTGAEQALNWTKQAMRTLGLSLNEEKTKLCDMDSGEFDFLGYTFGWITHHKTGKRYIGTRPSKKSVRSLKGKGQVHLETSQQAGVGRGKRSVESPANRMGQLL